MKSVKVKVEELIDADYNARILSAKDESDIMDSLDKFGVVEPILVNSNPERKNIIISGHQRVKILKKMKIEEVDVIYLDLSLEKERELNIRMNRNTGEFDFNLLEDYFSKEELMDWGFDSDQLNFNDLDFFDDDEEEQEDRKDKSTKVKFQVGSHLIFLELNEYEKIQQSLIKEVGFNDKDIVNLIAKRLGL